LQPLTPSSNITLKLFDSFLGICQFSGVFSIERGHVTLAGLHVVNRFFRQVQRAGGLVTLIFVAIALSR
jgi:hypothetical protein